MRVLKKKKILIFLVFQWKRKTNCLISKQGEVGLDHLLIN